MKPLITAAFFAVLLSLFQPAVSVGAGPCGTDPFGNPLPCADREAGGFGYYYDRASQTFYPEGALDGSETVGGVQVQLRYVVNCVGNTTDNPTAIGECSTSTCAMPDGTPGVSYQVYFRSGGGTDWTLRPGNVCRDVGDPIPLADVEAEIVRIIEERFQDVAHPEITLAPEANALVNLPVLASTPDPGPLGFDIVNPLPGRVEATSAYEWTWSNGVTSTGAGVGYDGTSPSRNPGYYPVQSTFTGGGSGSVDLQVTWSITLMVDGLAPITDIEPLEYEASAGFGIRSARTVLVDP
ncbi:MAG TPA: hypothetical protein VK585_06465 [Jiangellaceae bacterium]|nr:hypothetical protein [Jiangellaceae bacterium]